MNNQDYLSLIQQERNKRLKAMSEGIRPWTKELTDILMDNEVSDAELRLSQAGGI